MHRRIKNIIKKLLLLAVATLIACLAGEVALRLLGFHGVRTGRVGPVILVDDEILNYRLHPNIRWVNDYGIPVQINSKGWRDYEYEYAKEEGVFRILMLGDSILNGHGVRMEDVYAKHLERRLNARGSRTPFEVIMLSIGALSTFQEAHLLEVEGLKYDPDLLVVGYILNDPGAGSRMNKPVEEGDIPFTFQHAKNLLKRSSLVLHGYRTLEWIGWKLGLKIGGSKLGDHLIETDFYARAHEDEEKWGYVERAFKKISALCKARGIPGIVMIFPVFYRFDDYPWKSVHDKVAKAAAREGLMVLDLYPTFSKSREKDIRLGWGDYIHPNRLGHQVAGDALFRFLVEVKLID